MNKKSIEKANKLINAQNSLSVLRRIMTFPYPRMFSAKRDRETGFCYNNDYVSFSSLDDITREIIKTALCSIIDERYCEIEEEIKRL